jgi:hypothetical protein
MKFHRWLVLVSWLPFLSLFLISLSSVSIWASSPSPSPLTSSASAGSSTAKGKTVGIPKKPSLFGMSYFAFVNGPGLDPDLRSVPPNEIGRPDFTGLNSFNVISLKYRFSQNLAFDFQTRTRVVFNDGTRRKNFQNFFWESPRAGVSGKLMGGEDWSLTGALNTDFPSFLPSPLTGYTARERTVLMNPGLFASLRYSPKRSRWSLFTVMTPRFFFYRDREAIEQEALAAGVTGANKPELGLWTSPTVSYNFTEKSALTFGTSIGYVKQVGSSWSPTRATMISNANSPAWLLEAIPVSVGYSYTFNSAITVFPFIQAFPIPSQRFDAQKGTTASLSETASLGMWVNGTLF